MGDGLLIVNADDLGYDAPTTDAIVDCFARRRITSATAMVYMADSGRAARVARDAGIPVGLHLNLSEPYTEPGVPGEVNERQARLARRFDGRALRVRRLVYDPTIGRDLDVCIRDQLGCFEELYGRPPTHLDGHRHAHVSPNVLRSPAIPDAIRIRNALDTDRGGMLEPVRRARRSLIERRFTTTDHCFDFTDRQRALELAQSATVELVVHPALRDGDVLLSDEWGRALEGLRLGRGPLRAALATGTVSSRCCLAAPR
jgi:chitin disaccharide deacetylase